VTALDAVVLGALVGAIACADIRWLRVAQREHYLPGAGWRFGGRWWLRILVNLGLAATAAATAAAAVAVPAAGFVTAAVIASGPVGLGLRGRTSRLEWTRRMSFVAALAAGLEGLAITAAAVFGGLARAVFAAGLVALAVPILVDLALIIASPAENLIAERFVRRASKILGQVRPLVVAITGSYGKTTTKGYVAHLLAGERSVVASPRSFNNRAGLARTVNEYLSPGTEILVAEMGAYGPGEIAALCSWLRPDIAVVTAIGQTHLERFGTLERTLAAKAEITVGVRVVVLNVEDDRLRALADSLEATQKVLRVSGTDASADVAVLEHPDGLELWLSGKRAGVAILAPATPPPIRSNAACAVGVALELGISPEVVVNRLSSLPAAPHRLERYQAEAGYLVLDDTFNSNPAGARLALDALESEACAGRRVLVTPGMVELGRAQGRENAAFAERAAEVATDVVVVGMTNRAALLEGCDRKVRSPRVELVRTREEAVAWARAHLGPGDAVLFENDLPDHFP